MNRYITRGQEPGAHKQRRHKPDPTMFHKVTDAIAKDRNPVNRRSLDHAEADSLSERFAATPSTRLVRVTADNRARSLEIAKQMAAPNQPGPVTVVMTARFEIVPQRAPDPMWLLESADRSRVRVVVVSKTLRNAREPSADQ